MIQDLQLTNVIVLFIVCSILHFVGDFLLQTNEQAVNKSKSLRHLVAHCFTYALCYFWFGIDMILFMFVTHFMIDFVTSKVAGYYWAKEKRKEFFIVIGFDQLLHHLTIAAGIYMIVGGVE